MRAFLFKGTGAKTMNLEPRLLVSCVITYAFSFRNFECVV